MTTTTRHSSIESPGDFAGDTRGLVRPTLRIDWGTPAHAQTTLRTGRMQLVILHGRGPTLAITHELEDEDDTWRRRAYQPSLGTTRFSNRLRIVDDVPAFRNIRAAARLDGRERLAVLVPVPIETLFETGQLEAAIRHGLALEEISSIAGRFTVDRAGVLAFEVTDVQERNR
jgi:hypothetical protein